MRAIMIRRDTAESDPPNAVTVGAAGYGLCLAAGLRQAFRLPGCYMDAHGVMPAVSADHAAALTFMPR
jgi:hypothetical protein